MLVASEVVGAVVSVVRRYGDRIVQNYTFFSTNVYIFLNSSKLLPR